MQKYHEKKFIIAYLLIVFMGILILCFFLSWHEMRCKNFDISGLTTVSSEEEVLINIDKAKYKYINDYDGNELKIKGWCIIKGKETAPVAMHVLLKNKKSNKYIELPTSLDIRNDITEHFNDGVNYDNSGFSVDLYKKLQPANYEIVILYELGEEKFLIPSGKKIKVR